VVYRVMIAIVLMLSCGQCWAQCSGGQCRLPARRVVRVRPVLPVARVVRPRLLHR
jgi:hypothetical protein